MELNWLVISIVLVAAVSLIVFLVWQNHKDKKDLVRKIIDEDERSISKEPDTEIDSTE